MNVPQTIIWEDAHLRLLDQRKLPAEVTYLDINTLEDAIEAIKTLAVRGAPAIGIAAAYALVVAVRDASDLSQAAQAAGEKLEAARPTAVNLRWAVQRMLQTVAESPSLDALIAEACAIHEEDRALCRAIGEHGAGLITPGMNLLTHCNAGSLAVSELGTATAPMYLAHSSGVPFRVYADETRPLLQGARLTAWELAQAGIDVTLICDNMAATLMAGGQVDMVIVGTDRVARNGDVANKIGTLGLAVLANHFDVPFYVACPSSTFDRHTPTGADIEIEQRAASEVLRDWSADVPVYNPAFDVTPNSLVTGIITDQGIARAPLGPSLEELLA